MSTPKGPYKIVTINNAPERAKRLVGQVVENLKDRYTLQHVANAPSLDAAPALFEEHQPDVVLAASMWTQEESSQVLSKARELVPGVKTLPLPAGLQVQRGPEAVVEFLMEEIPKLIESK